MIRHRETRVLQITSSFSSKKRFNPYSRNQSYQQNKGFSADAQSNSGPLPSLMSSGPINVQANFSNDNSNPYDSNKQAGGDDYTDDNEIFSNNGGNFNSFNNNEQSESAYGNNGNNDEFSNQYDVDRNGGDDASSQMNATEFGIKMRGLPFKVTEQEIQEFFSPLEPANIVLEQKMRGQRPSGECHVFFATQDDINEALKYDKKYIGTRYIELFRLKKGEAQMSFPTPLMSDESANNYKYNNFDSSASQSLFQPKRNFQQQQQYSNSYRTRSFNNNNFASNQFGGKRPYNNNRF